MKTKVLFAVIFLLTMALWGVEDKGSFQLKFSGSLVGVSGDVVSFIDKDADPNPESVNGVVAGLEAAIYGKKGFGIILGHDFFGNYDYNHIQVIQSPITYFSFKNSYFGLGYRHKLKRSRETVDFFMRYSIGPMFQKMELASQYKSLVGLGVGAEAKGAGVNFEIEGSAIVHEHLFLGVGIRMAYANTEWTGLFSSLNSFSPLGNFAFMIGPKIGLNF